MQNAEVPMEKGLRSNSAFRFLTSVS
jgi:hypothetical protein